MCRPRHSQTGQTALIALLVLTIASTVGLSLIARGTTDLSVTRNIEESTRAFSAAEAGVEEALRSGIASEPTLDESLGLTYRVSVASISGTASTPFVFPKKTANGVTETIWLVNHDASGFIIDTVPGYTAPTIDVCWSQESTVPALVATVLYKESSDNSFQVVKGAYDPMPSALSERRATNHFSAPTATVGGCGAGTNTTYKQTIRFTDLTSSLNPATDTLIAIRIRPVYSGTQFAITPAATLPVQGKKIESVGSTTGGVNRKIIVYQQYLSPSTLFDAAVYSQGRFVHQ